MSRALSLEKPCLLGADISTKTGQSVQLGTLQFALGAMISIRNHAPHEALKLELAEALEMVAVFSLIAPSKCKELWLTK